MLFAGPLTETQRKEVGLLLRSDAEAALFFSQPPADQQHALAAARHAPLPLRRAALLHDVGKQSSKLGVWGRVLASGAAKLRIPVRGRFAQYLDHGPIGAGMLERLGAERVVVDYARHHHTRQPDSISDEDWAALADADRKARPNTGSPIR